MGNCPYELSGKRYTPSFLQGHPPSLRFGHPDVTTGDTAFLTIRRATPFLRSYRGTRPRYASGTLMMSLPEGIATPWGCRGPWHLGTLHPSSAPAGNPSSLRVGHPDVASGRDSYADGSLNRREAHPVLARQLRVRLHKALRSRTRGAENTHTLITHRLKQAQQLRGHVGCRQQRTCRVAQL